MSQVWTKPERQERGATPFGVDEDVAQPLLYMAYPTACPATTR